MKRCCKSKKMIATIANDSTYSNIMLETNILAACSDDTLVKDSFLTLRGLATCQPVLGCLDSGSGLRQRNAKLLENSGHTPVGQVFHFERRDLTITNRQF